MLTSEVFKFSAKYLPMCLHHHPKFLRVLQQQLLPLLSLVLFVDTAATSVIANTVLDRTL